MCIAITIVILNIFVGVKKNHNKISRILKVRMIYVPNSWGFVDWFIYFAGRHIIYKFSS